MSELTVLEQDAQNFLNEVRQGIETIFKDIITGSSYAEVILTDIIKNVIPLGETAISILAPKDLIYAQIISTISGDLEAVFENLNGTGQALSNAAATGSFNAAEVATLATSIQKTYQAGKASIEGIKGQVQNILSKAIITTPTA